MGASASETEIYCHTLPGRMRLKLPGLKGAPAQSTHLAALLSQLPGVTEAAANPTTGSLLILFDPRQTDHAAILAFLQERGAVDAAGAAGAGPIRQARPQPKPRAHPLAAFALSAGSAVGKEILKGALGHVLRDSPWALLLAVV